MMYYLLFAVLPFNLLIALVVTGITALVHKRLRVLYDMIGKKSYEEEADLSDFDEVDNANTESKEESNINSNEVVYQASSDAKEEDKKELL